MKKNFKKFGIMFVMAFAIMIGTCISAFADDGGVVGTANLNNTAENSAVHGSQLENPEKGWKRYDDSNKNISYNAIIGDGLGGHNVNLYTDGEYKGTRSWIGNQINAHINFNFIGTKIRIISFVDANAYSPKVSIKIDGKEEFFANNLSVAYKTRGSRLVYELKGLEYGEHKVQITELDNLAVGLDAIDIDEDGELLPELISLNNTVLNLNLNDTKELTASTTPAAVDVIWSSSDESIATVDQDGNVTAVGEGTCTITATINDGSGISASCVVNVTKNDTEPNDPTGDANLYIELVDGQIKQYSVSSDEINKFTEWYENRDKDHSLKATYKFTKGTYADYVVHDQIDWFEVR